MGCATMKDLIAHLGTVKSDEIEKKSKEISESEDFKIWMKKQGVQV